MGELTAIAWCHHTFNPWWGCVEVSPGCDHCYARTDATRYGHPVWGKDAERRFFSDKHWDEPMRWGRKAAAAGERRRVFCASMADVFEEREDVIGQELTRARLRLWFVIANTPALDWLLLTKRPAGMRRLLPPEIAALPNVWPGVTVENADYVWRIAELLKLECAGPRWVSYEPALGPVTFDKGPGEYLRCPDCGYTKRDVSEQMDHRLCNGPGPGLDWIIIGGESGPGARPFDLAWARSAIAQCRAAGVAVFVKQLGARPVESDGFHDGVEACCALSLRDRKGGSMEEWPSDLRIREFPR